MIKWAGQKICIWKKYWWLCFGRGNIRTTLQFKAATEEMRGGDETQILLSKTYIDRVSHTVCQWDQIPPRIICTYRWNQRAPWQSPPAISFLNEHFTSFCCIRVNVHNEDNMFFQSSFHHGECKSNCQLQIDNLVEKKLQRNAKLVHWSILIKHYLAHRVSRVRHQNQLTVRHRLHRFGFSNVKTHRGGKSNNVRRCRHYFGFSKRQTWFNLFHFKVFIF